MLADDNLKVSPGNEQNLDFYKNFSSCFGVKCTSAIFLVMYEAAALLQNCLKTSASKVSNFMLKTTKS